MTSAREHLEAAFGSAQPEHFTWQTEAPFVSERERDLVRTAFLPLGERVLDVGCGEGATLVHLGEPEGAVGVDLFEDKLVFARSRIPRCRFVTATANELPFDAGSFDHILIRDVVHHLDDPPRFVGEARRVIAAGGRIDVLEPCRYNPLIALHAITKPAERGELRSTMRYLTELFGRRFRVEETRHYQALPIHRIAFHPEMGWPRLGAHPVVRAAVDGLERVAARVMPSWAWAYLHVRAIAE